MRWSAAAAVLVAVAAGVAGCGSDPAAPAGTTGPGAGQPGAGQPSAGQPGAGTYDNPVYDRNFPDPGVLAAGDRYYTYGTNTSMSNVPLLTSADLVRWEDGGDVLPAIGAWARTGDTWAPEAVQVDADSVVLYYTARSVATGRQCIGRAVATSPAGPFQDPHPEPLVCQAAEGGSIDASPFRDGDGTLYLLWKNDGNALGLPTHLYAQPLSPDGLQLTGTPVVLLTNTAGWHAHVIEAPQLLLRDGRYYLFYSANAFDSDAYAVGYATCASALGPCQDAAENPILASGPGAAGPGHSYVVTGPDGGTWILYHAWRPESIGSVDPGRTLWLDRVTWTDGRPDVIGPTDDPQPAPTDR